MGKGIDKPSIDWGIQTFAAGSAGAGVVVGITGFYLLNVKSQIYCPGRMISVGAGPTGKGGFQRGASFASPSLTFFRTSTPLVIEDFSGMATMATGEMALGLGYAATWVTFWGVDHDPYWIDISGPEIGVGAGASITILCSVHFFDDSRRVVGNFVGPT